MTETENTIFEINLEEAIKEAQNRYPQGIKQGTMGIVLAIVGIFLWFPLSLLFGIIAIALGSFANKHGHRKLGATAGILGLFSVIGFLINLSMIF